MSKRGRALEKIENGSGAIRKKSREMGAKLNEDQEKMAEEQRLLRAYNKRLKNDSMLADIVARACKAATGHPIDRRPIKVPGPGDFEALDKDDLGRILIDTIIAHNENVTLLTMTSEAVVIQKDSIVNICKAVDAYLGQTKKRAAALERLVKDVARLEDGNTKFQAAMLSEHKRGGGDSEPTSIVIHQVPTDNPFQLGNLLPSGGGKG
jgi:uncharacterized protein